MLKKTGILTYLLIIFILLIDLYKITAIPAGFYIDELSIGYNAALVAQTGYDEHHQYLPVYFRAFGEYKNPVFIYVTAFIFRLFGVSEFNLRLTSWLFFVVFLISIYALSQKLFARFFTRLYILCAAGFIPWYFILSRIAFEVISQIALTALLIYLAYLFLQQKPPKISIVLLLGLLLALSIYTYSTARLLSPLLFIVLFCLAYKRQSYYTSLVFVVSFCTSLIPLFVYVVYNPGSLLLRFNSLTYLYKQTLTWYTKTFIFLQNYFLSFNPGNLLVTGDGIPRHTTGFGGNVQVAVFVLAVIMIILVVRKKIRLNRFLIFVLMCLVLAPIPVALTSESPHTLRSAVMGIDLLILSAYGFDYLLQIKHQRFAVCIFVLLMCQNLLFVRYYFTQYRSVSIDHFYGYDFYGIAKRAAMQPVDKIYFHQTQAYEAIYPLFYNLLLPASKRLLSISTPHDPPSKNTCVLHDRNLDEWVNSYPGKYYDITIPDSIYSARCFPR